MKAKSIVLIGMPGSGKTTIGKELSRKLNWEYIDTDDLIVKMAKKTIPELFAVSEAHFRIWEEKAVSSIPIKDKCVIGTGGGVVTQEKTMDILEKLGTIVYIERSLENILNTSKTEERPLLKENAQKRLEELFEKREPLYKKYQDITVDNNEDIKKTLTFLLSFIKNRE